MKSERFDEEALSLDTLEQVDRLCLDFERKFEAGRRPQIESFLQRVPQAMQPAALFYLVRLERDLLCERGQSPDLDLYQGRFPDHRELIQSAWDDPASFEVTLEVIIGPHMGRKFLFAQRDSFVVGRASCCHFRLPKRDPYFSRVHFLIEVNPPQCRLVDLCSLNGTLVNGQRLEWTDLRDGDLIQGGDTVIRVSTRIPEKQSGSQTLAATRPYVPKDVSQKGKTEPLGHATQHPNDLPQIPGYEILSQLGRGGMGTVHLAERLGDGAQVAVKMIRPTSTATDQQVQRFLREAQILCALRHPNIVSFHQFGRADRVLYIVMDLAPGSDASQLIKRGGPLPIDRAVRIISQTLDALHYAHGQGYVHRDVKPANLLISGSGRDEVCRLADFGLARVYFESPMSGLTLMGQVGGTLLFMAPEQIADFRNVGPAADQYSAAATFYYLITQQFIYDENPNRNDRQIVDILLSEAVPIEQRRRGIPAGLAKIVNKALAKSPDKRFSDAASFRDALSAYGSTG